MQTYSLIAPNKRFPKLQGWYLVVTTATQLMDMQEAHEQNMIRRLLLDPKNHLDVYQISNMCRNALQQKLARIEEGNLYINQMGGYCYGDVAVLQTVQSDRFPAVDPLIKVTITRFPDRQHWYLTSKDMIFDPAKHNTLEAAKAAASLYAADRNITVDNINFLVGRKEGD